MSEPSWVALGAAGEPEEDVQHDEVTVAGTRLIATKLLAGDAEPAFRIMGDGDLHWGGGGATAPDIAFYRQGGGGALNLEGAVLRSISLTPTGYGAFWSKVVGEATDRWRTRADGYMQWGDGATLDTTLYRYTANVLATDDQLRVFSTSGVVTVGIAGSNAVRHYLVDGDANAAMALKHNALEMGAGGASPADVSLFRAAADRWQTNDKLWVEDLNLPTKAGVPVDGDVAGGAQDGDVIWDTTGKKLYVRTGGVWTVAGGGGAWQIVLTALANEPQPTSFATFDTRNGHPVLDYDAGSNEGAMFRGVLPASYAGGGLNVKLIWAATTAVAGNVVWAVGLERIAAGAQDLDVNSFAANNVATAACDTVSGETTETTIAISSGANMDSLAAGEMFRMSVYRDAVNASDTMAGDAELLAAVITEQ